MGAAQSPKKYEFSSDVLFLAFIRIIMMNLSGIKLLILESFRSEDENECLSIIHGASTRFNLKFLRVFLKKKKTLRKASIYFFHQKSQYGYLY